MLTRTVAALITTPVLAVLLASTGPAATAGQTWNSPAPPGCEAAGYPAGYGIWCPGIVHVVIPGDSLWELAQADLGNGHLWPEIEVIGGGRPGPCTRPAEIFPGQILLIPLPGASPAPGGQPGCPPAQDHGTPSPSSSPSRGPATATPRPSARNPRGTASPRPRQHISPAPLRLLSEVLAGLGALAAISAAVISLRRRRRRQRSRATIIPVPGQGGSQLASPVPASAPGRTSQPSGRHAGADQGEDLDDPYGPDLPEGTGPDPSLASFAFLTAPPDRAPRSAVPGALLASSAVGPPGDVLVGVRDGRGIAAGIAAAGGLGLTGAGAPAAARAILGALLSRAQPGPQVPVIVPADVTGLLPAAAAEERGAAGIIPGLSRPASLTAALDDIEALILRRARLAGDPDAGDRSPDTAAGEAAVLIAIPGQRDIPRLRSITAGGKDPGVMLIVLGEWSYGATCHVAADGMVTAATPAASGLDGTRLYRLDSGDLSAFTGITRNPPGNTATATSAPHPPARQPPSPGLSAQADWPGRGPVPAAAELAHEQPPAPTPATPLPGIGTPEGNRPVRVSVLGPLQITAAGSEIGTGARKARELIAFLAVHGADGATGDAISEAMWPGASYGYGKRQRNIALRKARDLLRNSTGRSGPMWIVLTADRYRLDPALTEADLRQFHAALEAARTASTDQERLAALRQAVSYYRGSLCDSAGYDWTEPYAETARHGALDAWTRIAGILQDTDPEQALAALQSALTHDPYNESIYQQIMRLQAAAGRTDAVRRTFQLLETRLAELAATPGSGTRQLAASLVGASGPHPRSVGSCRIRPLMRTVRRRCAPSAQYPGYMRAEPG